MFDMPANFDMPVVKVEVWHKAQPTPLNRLAPFLAEADIGAGVGGAESRMKAAKFTRSEDRAAAVPVGLPLPSTILVASSGEPLYTQPAPPARSLPKASFETPCSTL